MWRQKKLQYTICTNDFNRKIGMCLDQKRCVGVAIRHLILKQKNYSMDI